MPDLDCPCCGKHKISVPCKPGEYKINCPNKSGCKAIIRIYGEDKPERIEAYCYCSSCFIATAAFGTPLAEEINILRWYRDNILTRTTKGKVFVRSYYTISPPIAKLVEKCSLLRYVTRKAIGLIIKSIKSRFNVEYSIKHGSFSLGGALKQKISG